MKLQTPNSKPQRNSKSKTGVTDFGYPEVVHVDWSVEEDSTAAKHPFDLEERTARFGEAAIHFLKRVPRGPNNDRLIARLTGCATSIGANYCEASEGVSKKDFRNIVGRCVKEAKETKFFLRMIAASEPTLAHDARQIYREAKELHLIFASMYRNTKP
jgi:four helix bundle protein